MPLRAEQPMVGVEHSSVCPIGIRSTENSFGLWSVFSKCLSAMEYGKRYGYMGLRLLRKTFPCQPDPVAAPQQQLTTRSTHMLEQPTTNLIQKKLIEPLSTIPAQFVSLVVGQKPVQDNITLPSTACPIPDASTSTVATTVNCGMMSPVVGSEASTSTDVSEHSVVRGFKPGHISSLVRSSTNLNSTPILKKADVSKKQHMFTISNSSEKENGSSFEAYSLQRSSHSQQLRNAAPTRKTTLFENEVSTCTFHKVSKSIEAAIESDSDEDDIDESAIEGEDSDEEWEDDDNEESGPHSVSDHCPQFPRVKSKANLTSCRSLLTTALHQGDCAFVLQNTEPRLSPVIRRSRTHTFHDSSARNSPHEDSGLMMREQASRPKPIIMTTSNIHPPAMSPKTTTRNMLTSELTGSLRQNLLWEKQQNNATTNAVAKRQQSTVDLPALRRAMTTGDVKGLNTNEQQAQIRSTTSWDDNKPNSWYNQYFERGGVQGYYLSGW